MRIAIDHGTPMFPHVPPRLWLYAENDEDRADIEVIEQNYLTTNYGRGHHVAVELRTPEQVTPAARPQKG